MQIILLESLKKIGKAGEVVTVKDGYANNFLIPQKKAIVANKANKKSLDSRITEINKKNEVKVSEAIKKQKSMENITIELSMECNEEDKLYGSITKKQISDHLIGLGHEVSPDMIVIDDIKSLGEFSSTVQIYEDIESQLKIIISKNNKEEIIDLKGPEHLFFFEAELASQSIAKEKTQAPYPAMSWDDTLSNLKALDQWRSRINYKLPQDDL